MENSEAKDWFEQQSQNVLSGKEASLKIGECIEELIMMGVFKDKKTHMNFLGISNSTSFYTSMDVKGGRSNKNGFPLDMLSQLISLLQIDANFVFYSGHDQNRKFRNDIVQRVMSEEGTVSGAVVESFNNSPSSVQHVGNMEHSTINIETDKEALNHARVIMHQKKLVEEQLASKQRELDLQKNFISELKESVKKLEKEREAKDQELKDRNQKLFEVQQELIDVYKNKEGT